MNCKLSSPFALVGTDGNLNFKDFDSLLHHNYLKGVRGGIVHKIIRL